MLHYVGKSGSWLGPTRLNGMTLSRCPVICYLLSAVPNSSGSIAYSLFKPEAPVHSPRRKISPRPITPTASLERDGIVGARQSIFHVFTPR